MTARTGRTVSTTTITLVVLWSTIVFAARLPAKTSDGQVSTQESACDGLVGATRGLCKAYCEAQDCDVRPRHSCERLRKKLEKQTGTSVFPCDQPRPTVTAVPTSTMIATATVAPTHTTTAIVPTPTQSPNGGPTPVGNKCPSLIEFSPDAGADGVLDSGWTGLSHDEQIVSDGTITVGVTACDNPSEPCGVCDFAGPIPNPHADGGDIENQRCTGNTRVKCTDDGDCASAGGTCEFFFGSLLPLSAGGVSTCVSNQIDGAISGTVNIETGSSASTVNLISHVFSAPLTAQPCPRCEGDGTPNDGVRGGTCDSGQNVGQTCDVNGSAPNPIFGATSLDCQPLPGDLLAALPINLSNSTGTEARTLSDASPNCRAPGFTDLKCFCDTCDNADATPCATNADCPAGGICGGKRCRGGSNNGNACATSAECPEGSCSVPGLATAPNQCDDATCSSSGECSMGPFDQYCGPTATFKGCASDEDCIQFAGNTCSIGEFRPCFTDNGEIGASVTATGQPGPFDASGVADAKLASRFCIGPTASAAVNASRGLPGLGRLELPVQVKLNPSDPFSPEQECRNAGGLWSDCGPPDPGCFCPDTVCTAICISDCLCGGIPGFTCPQGKHCNIADCAVANIGICE